MWNGKSFRLSCYVCLLNPCSRWEASTRCILTTNSRRVLHISLFLDTKMDHLISYGQLTISILIWFTKRIYFGGDYTCMIAINWIKRFASVLPVGLVRFSYLFRNLSILFRINFLFLSGAFWWWLVMLFSATTVATHKAFAGGVLFSSIKIMESFGNCL